MDSGSGIEVIINAISRAPDKEETRRLLAERFAASGVDARISLARSGADIVALAQRAVEGSSRTVVAGGGDGTVNAVASVLVGTDKSLGVLPLGTFNYFARNLGIPVDLDGAATTLIEGRVAKVCVGDVNGRTFLNNASLGLYPAMLLQREGTYKRWGRSRLAAYWSVAVVMLRPAAFLHLRFNDEQLPRRTPLVFVGNNGFQLEEFNLRGRACLDAGNFAFYITHPVGRLGLWRLAMRGLLRRLQDADDFQVSSVKEAWVETRRKRLRVAMDGELVMVTTPLHFRARPGALSVIVPAAAAAREASAE